MKKLLTYTSLLLLTLSCSSNKSVVAATSIAPQQVKTSTIVNGAKPMIKLTNNDKEETITTNINNPKPVVLKRTMHKPAVI